MPNFFTDFLRGLEGGTRGLPQAIQMRERMGLQQQAAATQAKHQLLMQQKQFEQQQVGWQLQSSRTLIQGLDDLIQESIKQGDTTALKLLQSQKDDELRQMQLLMAPVETMPPGASPLGPAPIGQGAQGATPADTTGGQMDLPPIPPIDAADAVGTTVPEDTPVPIPTIADRLAGGVQRKEAEKQFRLALTPSRIFAEKRGAAAGMDDLRARLNRSLTPEEEVKALRIMQAAAQGRSVNDPVTNAFNEVAKQVETNGAKWAADTFDVHMRRLNGLGISVSPELVSDYRKQLLSADKLLAGQLAPAQFTRMIEIRDMNYMIDQIVGTKDAAGQVLTEGIINDPEVAEKLGPIQQHFTAINRWFQDPTFALDDKQREALFFLEFITEKMGRKLTGAAVQPFERVVFNRLFGGPNVIPEQIRVNLAAFRKILTHEEEAIWNLTYDINVGGNPNYEKKKRKEISDEELLNELPQVEVAP